MKLQICDSNSESVFCNRISHPHSFAPTFLFAKNFCIWQFCILLNFELRRSKLLHPSFHFSSQSNDFDEYFFSWRSRDFRNFYFVGRIYLGRFVIGILFSFNGSDFVIRIIFEEYLNFWCDPFFFFFSCKFAPITEYLLYAGNFWNCAIGLVLIHLEQVIFKIFVSQEVFSWPKFHSSSKMYLLHRKISWKVKFRIRVPSSRRKIFCSMK